MERGLLFFTISILCLWMILDEFFGEKRLSRIATSLTPQNGDTANIPMYDYREEQKAKTKMKKQIEKDKKLSPSEKKWKKNFWDNFFNRGDGMA